MSKTRFPRVERLQSYHLLLTEKVTVLRHIGPNAKSGAALSDRKGSLEEFGTIVAYHAFASCQVLYLREKSPLSLLIPSFATMSNSNEYQEATIAMFSGLTFGTTANYGEMWWQMFVVSFVSRLLTSLIVFRTLR